MENIKPFDEVALLEALPSRGLLRGQVGTVVETLAPDAFEVEFSDNEGRSHATVALRRDQLMILHHEDVDAAAARSAPQADPLLGLVGSGKHLWAGEHADEYVSRLREGCK
jgi:hypothetical protein